MKNQSPVEKPIFLLGGHDLEMITIRQLLDRNGQLYHDLCLQWGAPLSAYSRFFHPDKHYIGIELREDTTPPPRYLAIDHHNERATEPSSIEQVAALLGVSLSRYEQMVAANDKGYIPAMEAMGCTPEEIKTIREADRRAQGVTELDEMLARQSLKNTITRGDLLIVEALTSRFSSIADRLFPFNNLLIYTQHELTLYGPIAPRIAERYSHFIASGVAYSGGGATGFFGIARDALSPAELLVLRSEITTLTL